MAKIIISYRRTDTDAISGRIRDRLVGQFGPNSIFMDIDNIPFGIDFRDHIQDALHRCDVVVVIVGAKWTGHGKGNRTRINEQSDPVRIEVETALKRGVPVVPVLVNGARMPTAEELPESVAAFAFRNAATVDTGRDFHAHMDRLIRAIQGILEAKSVGEQVAASQAADRSPPVAEKAPPPIPTPAPTQVAPATPTPRRQSYYWLALAGVVAMLLGVGAVFLLQPKSGSPAVAVAVPPVTPAPTIPVAPPITTPPAPEKPTTPAACSSTSVASFDATRIPPPGIALRDAVKRGVIPFFLCASLPIESFARVFATLSVVIAEYAPNPSCFRGDAGAAGTGWSGHKGWAERRGRTDLMLVNLTDKIDLAHACIAEADQPLFYVDMARAFAAATAPGNAWTFTNPTLKGSRIDRCLNFGRDCNDPAALALCERHGFTSVAKWQWEFTSPTVTLGDRLACAGNCGAFTTVACTR